MLGLDIGGANLKAATSAGVSRSVPFPLWKHPERLGDALAGLVREFPGEHELAVTMTAELCDCYASKSDGVRSILRAVERIAETARVWTTSARFVTIAEALADPLPAAAANWLALATYVGRLAPHGPALLVDIGSTTTDIIPLLDGRPTPRGRTDPDRLACGELVYCGVRRTPLCAIFGLAKAAEFFATTEDLYLALGRLPESPERTDTADGRPATRIHALARLARMECADVDDGSRPLRIATMAQSLQVQRLADMVLTVAARMPGPVESVVLAGSGRFLLEDVLVEANLGHVRIVSLDESISAAACAYAVAVLAEESR